MRKTYRSPSINIFTSQLQIPLAASGKGGLNSNGTELNFQGFEYGDASTATSRASDDWDWDWDD